MKNLMTVTLLIVCALLLSTCLMIIVSWIDPVRESIGVETFLKSLATVVLTPILINIIMKHNHS